VVSSSPVNFYLQNTGVIPREVKPMLCVSRPIP